MHRSKLLPIGLIALAAMSPTAARAVTYDVVASFSATLNPNGPFSYGYRIGTGSFVPYNASTAVCAGIAGLACQYSSTFNTGNLPAVAINTTGALLVSGSVRVPTNELLLHPVGLDSGLPAGDTIVRFTAPATSLYSVAGVFQTLDTRSNGGTVNVSIEGGTSVFAAPLTGPLNNTDPFNFTTLLAAGSTLDFVVNSAGSYFGDSTGLRATLTTPSTAIPEPVSMMVLGLGLASLALVRRRT